MEDLSVSIKKSIRTILMISSTIPVILLTLITLAVLSHRMSSVHSSTLKQLVEANQIGLSSIINMQMSEVALLSQEDVINNCLSNEDIPSSNDDVVHLFDSRRKLYLSRVETSLYNNSHVVIASTIPDLVGTIASTSIFDQINESKQVSIHTTNELSISKNTDLTPTIEIGAPILDPKNKNHVTGYVINTLDLSYFTSMLNAITIGETGYGILLSSNGTILYHPDQSLFGHNINSDKLSSLVQDYNHGNIPASGILSYSYENVPQVYAYSILPQSDWVLLVKQDRSEMQSHTTVILNTLFIVCTVILLLSFLLTRYLTRKITDPIISLRDVMKTASDGDLTVQSNIKSTNELGELSKNFNKMLHIINSNYEDLASMHEELLSNEEQLRSNYDHIEYLAYHDTLTNLPNKLSFLDYMNAVLASRHQGISHAVYFVDLDNFKLVNDTLGHEYGDILLSQTAHKLRELLGMDGMLARAGGDEFLIFKENINGRLDAVAFASRIIDLFRNPFDLDGEIVYISLSIGISIYPENGISTNTLIKNADIAMYKSKDTGKNKFTIFNTKMEHELNRNTLILEILRTAIENKEIYVQYQPLYELETNKVCGFEALMRIRSERLGPISPTEFIPIAEESGLIVELSSWLLKEVCTFNKWLIDHGIATFPVAVNISSVQINRPGFIQMLSDILEETGLPAEYLELEITESTLVSSIMDATQLLAELQTLGVKVSLDDFGTGYSSLNYLTKLPIDTLKIDKSFVDNICHNEKDSYIAESIIQLAHNLKVKVVAEGVEDLSQLALLREKKCDIIQGYIFSTPLHPPSLIDILKEA